MDLIFRQAGYLRTNTIGGPQKTKDIELLSPVTNEKILVQVKTSTTQSEIEQYSEYFRQLDVPKINPSIWRMEGFMVRIERGYKATGSSI